MKEKHFFGVLKWIDQLQCTRGGYRLKRESRWREPVEMNNFICFTPFSHLVV